MRLAPFLTMRPACSGSHRHSSPTCRACSSPSTGYAFSPALAEFPCSIPRIDFVDTLNSLTGDLRVHRERADLAGTSPQHVDLHFVERLHTPSLHSARSTRPSAGTQTVSTSSSATSARVLAPVLTSSTVRRSWSASTPYSTLRTTASVSPTRRSLGPTPIEDADHGPILVVILGLFYHLTNIGGTRQ